MAAMVDNVVEVGVVVGVHSVIDARSIVVVVVVVVRVNFVERKVI